jgi:methanogenic corrinoid protein MtbC1
VDDAIAAGCRPVDILIGMIAPMLHQIGEAWERGTISVKDERQFTAFCERVIDLVAHKVRATAGGLRSDAGPVLLMNAPGNKHSLAIQIIALWLRSFGRDARIIDSKIGAAALEQEFATSRSRLLLISMALRRQRKSVQAIVERIQAWPKDIRPRVVVGGYAIKSGAELLWDLRTLSLN